MVFVKCIKDVVMNGFNETAFIKGKVYQSTEAGYENDIEVRNEQEGYHFIKKPGNEFFDKHFELIEVDAEWVLERETEIEELKLLAATRLKKIDEQKAKIEELASVNTSVAKQLDAANAMVIRLREENKEQERKFNHVAKEWVKESDQANAVIIKLTETVHKLVVGEEDDV